MDDPNESHRNDPRWPMMLFRWSMTLTSALMFGQAVLAGLFMSGASGAFALHRETATIAGVALMAGLVATILARIFAHAPNWPIFATMALLGLMSLQAFAGYRSLVALHVPLGVAVILLSVALTAWAWRRPSPAYDGSGIRPDATPNAGETHVVSALSR